MTLRLLVTATALFAAPLACASVAMPQPGTETTTTASVAARTTQVPRKIERPRPGTPMKPGVIEAPGAALMMIPASYDPSQSGPLGLH